MKAPPLRHPAAQLPIEIIMRSNTSNLKSFRDPSYSTFSWRYQSMRPKVHIHRLNRCWKLLKEAKEMTRAGKSKREMQVKNMKLYKLNKSIVEENEKLRRRAMILLQEKKVLLSQFQKIPHLDSDSNKH